MSDKTVKCWGDNNFLALGGTSESPWPIWSAQTGAVKVDGIANATQLVSGHSFNCALLGDKTVKCWGKNDFGQLGNASSNKTDSSAPWAAFNVGNVVAIAAGQAHACALISDGDVKCWGANGPFGMLGNNSTTESLNPVSTSAGMVFQ